LENIYTNGKNWISFLLGKDEKFRIYYIFFYWKIYIQIGKSRFPFSWEKMRNPVSLSPSTFPSTLLEKKEERRR
jgi:hypothetical protein